ncbi:DUF4245 family protein [Actinokineospora globicatena]|uniref:DUF4245 domain-containing protein n=1 Tax=Actinokineospora globicatena TaxID=103729 RepID=A0A9W6QQ52_9PSEU|nr:DUF4245 family protein [Actinokineospora globicatena]GLW92755.1 hypothetical protein Aglo03_35710 [Actinokineospora globicatena]
MAPGNRLTHGPRDILLSLLALLLIVGTPLLLTRACTFSPGAPQADPASAPRVDVTAGLSRAQAPFRVRVPSVPAAWQGNSYSSGRVDPNGRVVRAGWLTPEHFIQLSQSDAELTDLVAAEVGTLGLAKEAVTVDGTQWTVFPGRRDELAWVADVSGVRLLITGNATDADFRLLAAAATG